MLVGMIIIAFIAAFLAAVSVRLYQAMKEWQDMANELQEENEALRADTGALCREKITLSETIDELEIDNMHLKNQLDDALTAYENAEKERIRMVTAAKTQQEEPGIAANEVLQANAKERLPEGVATNRYDCEGYEFPEGTQQARLQNECFTDTSTGTRIYGLNNSHFYANGHIVSGYYCVAMGTAYGVDIGDAWFVKLKNGNGFNIILADYQHDISDPDPDDFGERYEYDSAGNIVGLLRNYDGEICVHVLEFIADIRRLPQEVKEAGGMHGLDFFGGKYGTGGNIAKIKYLGRVWEP